MREQGPSAYSHMNREQLEQYAQSLELQLLFDPITGAKSRYYFDSQVVPAIESFQGAIRTERRREYPKEIVVSYFDLNDFKAKNDTYGHAYGDSVLREFTVRAVSLLRQEDTFVRLSGDEFVAIQSFVKSIGDYDAFFAAFSARLQEHCADVTTFSAGYARASEFKTPTELFAAADKAMYCNKPSTSRRRS